MRKTFDLPENLLADTIEATHQRTKTAVIVTALEDLVRKSRIRELRNFRGKVNLWIWISTPYGNADERRGG